MSETNATTPVPLLDLGRAHETLLPELIAAAERVFRHGRFVLGPEVAELEAQLADWCGVQHAVACASGSDALLLALMALELPPGSEVITTPYTFFSTVSAITRLGLKPVFVDIDPATFLMDVNRVADVLTAQTRAVIPVHLFGQVVPMDDLKALCAEKDLYLIEDAAQALGARWKGDCAGTIGDIGCLSFYPTKNLAGLGDAGALLTNDDALAAKLKILHVHGMEPKYYHQEVGVNSRLDTLQAAFLLLKLPHLEAVGASRRAVAARYRKNLFDLHIDLGMTDCRPAGGRCQHPSCIRKSDTSGIALPAENLDGEHVFNQFVIRHSRRDALRVYLAEAGVGSEIYYPLCLHEQACFAGLGYKRGDFPKAECAAATSLALPAFGELTAEEVDTVCAHIRAFCEGAA